MYRLIGLHKTMSRRITQNMYDRKYQEYRTEQKDIKSELIILLKQITRKLPLYDVFRHLKQELKIDLNDLKRFFEGSKTPSFFQNSY